MKKEVKDPAIELYLHTAWREAKQVISKMPPNTEKIKKGKSMYYASSPSEESVKHYWKKLLLILSGIFIWLSIFHGMSELLYKILPDVFVNELEHWGRKENESNMIYIISGVFSLACFYMMYMGYKYYQKGHFGEGLPIPGQHISRTVDRDELICNLEKKFNLLDKIDKMMDDGEYSTHELIEIKNQLSAVIELKETKEDQNKNLKENKREESKNNQVDYDIKDNL